MQLVFILFVLLFTADAFSPLSTTQPFRSTQLYAVTPNQIKFLRKEAAQRLARKSMPQVFLSEDILEDETLETIHNELQQHELVQVRGISRDNIRHVYATTQQLILELNLLDATRTVDLVETTGHSAVLYAPADPPQIVLRSSYKEGQWSKKAEKAKRYSGANHIGW